MDNVETYVKGLWWWTCFHIKQEGSEAKVEFYKDNVPKVAKIKGLYNAEDGKSGEFELSQTEPGKFEASIPMEDLGFYNFSIKEKEDGEVKLTTPLLAISIILFMLDIAYRRLNLYFLRYFKNRKRDKIKVTEEKLAKAKLDKYKFDKNKEDLRSKVDKKNTVNNQNEEKIISGENKESGKHIEETIDFKASKKNSKREKGENTIVNNGKDISG